MSVPPEVEELIAGAPLSAHVATSVDDRPHVAPVWYGYEDGVVSVLTGGKKLRNIRRNSRVAISIEKASEGSVEWNVCLLGTATVIEDPDRMSEAEGEIFGKYQQDGGEPEGALVEIEIGSAKWSVY